MRATATKSSGDVKKIVRRWENVAHQKVQINKNSALIEEGKGLWSWPSRKPMVDFTAIWSSAMRWKISSLSTWTGMDWSVWKRRWTPAAAMAPLTNSGKLMSTTMASFTRQSLTFPLFDPRVVVCLLYKAFLLHLVFQDLLTDPWLYLESVDAEIHCHWNTVLLRYELPSPGGARSVTSRC